MRPLSKIGPKLGTARLVMKVTDDSNDRPSWNAPPM